MTVAEIKELVLSRGVYAQSTLYKLKKGSRLRIRPGPDLIGEQVQLFTNYPLKGEFLRSTYHEVGWSYVAASDRTSLYADILVSIPGAFHYYITAKSAAEIAATAVPALPADSVGDGYFLVEPELTCRGRHRSVDSVVCQTVLSKLMGHLDTWEDKLLVAYHSGYNMIHFTPIQVLGASNSAYSLAGQLELNPSFSAPGRPEATLEDVEELMARLRKEYGMLSICDIVLNHTANETPWLADHPDATFNLVNSPHLRPAFLLDRAIARMAADIGEGRWVRRGVPKGEVTSADQLAACRDILLTEYIPKVKLDELFIVNTAAAVEEFRSRCAHLGPPASDVTDTAVPSVKRHLQIIEDPDYKRFGSSVDMDLALELFNVPRAEAGEDEARRQILCVEAFGATLEWLNKIQMERLAKHVACGVDNVFKGATYERVDPGGPMKKGCSAKEEFVTPYFTCPPKQTLEEEMELLYSQEGAKCMAHNGWVMGDDPLSNFARPGSNVYLRRELIAWGDSVKLRYGEKPEDSPFLWQHMCDYTTLTARIFDGIRLDNCHSTPLHVAAYMLDHARKVRPDLYVVAELFTGSEEKDNIFVNNLGITSLIREGLAAWDSHELGRLVFKYGGQPVGSFAAQPNQQLAGHVAHALFLDWTHDNPSPAEKRTIPDMLPSAGLVAMAACAVGSNRGYDELVPHHIHVVNEMREYAAWNSLDPNTGIMKARKALSDLHVRLDEEGFTEVFVDQLTKDMVAVTRHCPQDRRSVIMVSHTCFCHVAGENNASVQLGVEGRLEAILLEAKMVRDPVGAAFAMRRGVINGVEDWRAEVRSGTSDMIKILDDGKGGSRRVQVDLSHLAPGSLVVLAVSPVERHAAALAALDALDLAAMEAIVAKFGLAEVNFALYQCDQEGRDNGGYGTYDIPNFGPLNYCGLAGLVPVLNRMRPANDLGHPLAANLRAGNWLMEYIGGRLANRVTTKPLAAWLKAAFDQVAQLPRYLVPRYFDSVLMAAYHANYQRSLELMGEFVAGGSEFVQRLAQGTVIHLAAVSSACLPPLSPALLLGGGGDQDGGANPPPTLAAGLPHFCTGYTRSWGRDTFISLRGLLLTTGRFREARDMILGYAGCLRHGLIPNLLDGGRNARFNCRDAVWWWLQAIIDYINISPDGVAILDYPVLRLFPTDDQAAFEAAGGSDQLARQEPLHSTIHEALIKHWRGRRFREWNAGRRIDEHMTDNGFNNAIGVDRTTGFVFGGNGDNCGTWMDKMGSSEAAGNRGVPSTPRDGSAVEIVGLAYACLAALSKIPEYKHQELASADGSSTILLSDWAALIKAHFEQHFWIPPSDGADVDVVEPHPELVNLRAIYKDSLGSSRRFTDYQLRPNFAIVLAVAPELVDPAHAWRALGVMRERLLGPLGLATLDSKDWAYRGDYLNSNQSTDPTVAHGANYHQGPEWLWPVGFMLRGMLRIGKILGPDHLEEAKAEAFKIMSRHFQHLIHSPWFGLPELTNSKGAHCHDSNPIQAWSHATLLDTLYDIQTNNF